MNITAIIQARVGSTRLPGKILLKLEGKTVLEHVVERVALSKMINQVVVATTIKDEDQEVKKICDRSKVKCFRGAENDVLDRYYQAARLFNAGHIVRITADCPLIDPEIIDEVIQLHLKEKADYTANTIKEWYPDGLDVEVFNFASLTKAWEKSNLASQREHVTPYLRNNRDIFKIASLEAKQDLSGKRWTLDNQEDFEFIGYIYKNLYPKYGKNFGINQILDFLKRNPEIEKINSHIERNSGYRKSLKEDKALGNRVNG